MMLSSVPSRLAQESRGSQTPGELDPEDGDASSSRLGESLDSFKLSPTTQGNILNNNHALSGSNALSSTLHDSRRTQFQSKPSFIRTTEALKPLDVSSSSSRLIQLLVRPYHDHDQSRMGKIVQSLGNESRDDDKLKEFEIETERLLSSVEHLRAENDVLSINLEETKSHADHLTVLLRKFESNNVALQMTLDFSDQAIEAYDVLVALLESELGQLLANCRAAAGSLVIQTEPTHPNLLEHKDQELVEALLQRAFENRCVAETVARNLLIRNVVSPNSENSYGTNGIIIPRYHHLQPSSPQSATSRASSSSSSSSNTNPSSPNSDILSPHPGNLEKGIRHRIIQLKTNREVVRATIVNLKNTWNMESAEMVPLSPCDLIEARRLDLETAILMQELMAIREERAELRSALFHGEQDRLTLQLKIESQETQALAHKARINYLTSELRDKQMKTEQVQLDNSPTLNGNTNTNVNTNMNLNQEVLLKKKIEELVNTLEKVSEATTEREEQTNAISKELRQANEMLIQTMESHKRKYQLRIEKLEDQIMDIMQRHSKTVKSFQDKIYSLETNR